MTDWSTYSRVLVEDSPRSVPSIVAVKRGSRSGAWYGLIGTLMTAGLRYGWVIRPPQAADLLRRFDLRLVLDAIEVGGSSGADLEDLENYVFDAQRRHYRARGGTQG